MSTRSEALAARLEQGAQALAAFAETLSDAEWRTVVPADARTVGVLVHHLATVYSGEGDLERDVAAGKPIAGLTWDIVAEGNAQHAEAHASVSKQETLELLRRNSRMAADRIRQFTDEELDRAAPVSLNGDAPLTTQFLIEDHALRHSFHHLANIRAALNR